MMKNLKSLMKLIKNLKENNIKFYWNYKYNLKKSLQKANREKITRYYYYWRKRI